MTEIKIKIGQHWQEVDPRFESPIKEVLGADREAGGEWRVKLKSLENGKITTAQLKRFHGKRGGYKLVKDIDNG